MNPVLAFTRINKSKFVYQFILSLVIADMGKICNCSIISEIYFFNTFQGNTYFSSISLAKCLKNINRKSNDIKKGISKTFIYILFGSLYH